MTMDIEKEVSRYVELCTEHEDIDLDSLVHILMSNGVTEMEAEALIAFVPMGFAHELLSGAGVKLPQAFLIHDSNTEASVRGVLSNEPIFEASRSLARRMFDSPLTRERAGRVAEQSAECAAIRALCPDGQDIEGCVLTEAVLIRLPIEYLGKQRSGSSWRFWKRG
jgi:hypothetical protein